MAHFQRLDGVCHGATILSPSLKGGKATLKPQHRRGAWGASRVTDGVLGSLANHQFRRLTRLIIYLRNAVESSGNPKVVVRHSSIRIWYTLNELTQ